MRTSRWPCITDLRLPVQILAALGYDPLTCLFTNAKPSMATGRVVSMQKSVKQAWELGFFFSPLFPVSVGSSVIMRAVTLGMFLFLLSGSPQYFLSLKFRTGSEMLSYIIFPPPVFIFRVQVIPLLWKSGIVVPVSTAERTDCSFFFFVFPHLVV